ncbi:hypothetical protein GGR53DRAFT_403135 [Hypoxylon sp. FL1150]|nr:hypothetical protein GGR53DRAFT_403135 [Hypoxylon sp. FL1150]
METTADSNPTSPEISGSVFVMDDGYYCVDDDFAVNDNLYASTPGHLSKPINPKPFGAFQALDGLAGLSRRFEPGQQKRSTLSQDEIGTPLTKCGETDLSRPLGGFDMSESKVNIAAESFAGQNKPRRGRGRRRNAASWKERNRDPDAHPFDERELLFGNEHGSLKVPRLANLDTQLKINKGSGDDLIMSSHCARELGILGKMSTDFEDPCLQSISGHSTAVRGILRNVQFRLKGSSVTFRRNFWVCDAINGVVDVMIGANFIKDNFRMLFEKVKGCDSTFATWISKKKETPEQKREREELERQQKIKINDREIKRLQKENEMHQRASEANPSNDGSAQSGAPAMMEALRVVPQQ